MKGKCCPLCGGERLNTIRQFDSVDAAQHFSPKEIHPLDNAVFQSKISDLWDRNTAELISCDSCGFYFVSPFVAGDTGFYSLFYNSDKYPAWKWEYNVAESYIKEKYASDIDSKEVLEIGAGNGAFIKVLLKIIPPTNITATEYSDYGIEILSSFKVRVVSVDIRDEEFRSDSKKYDVIAMFQILEHLDNYRDLFEVIDNKLRDGGLLIIAVPNALRTNFDELYGAWIDYPPMHISRWTLKSFEKLAENMNYNLSLHQIEPQNGWKKFLQFVLYRYTLKTKKSKTIYNFTETIRNRIFRYIFQIPLLIFELIKALPLIGKLGDKSLGASQIAILSKG